MRLLVALVALFGALAAAVPPALGAERPLAPVTYAPPVDAPLVGEFRAPPSPYAAGNRGIDYATDAGTLVRAAAAGEVTFAGQVGGALHVVVLHADGLRTSYSFLRSTSVRRGQRVSSGAPLGVTSGPLHFGARAGETYVDPAVLLAGGPPQVHLVPLEERRPQSEAQERNILAKALARVQRLPGIVASASADAVAWARDGGELALAYARVRLTDELDTLAAQLALLIHYSEAFNPAYLGIGGVRSFLQWWHRDCTSGDAQVPPREQRRILVLVAGFGSASHEAGVLDLDTQSLGYAPEDVALFSYRGGRAPGVGGLTGVPTSHYTAADSQGDLREAGRRLRVLLRDIRFAHPGVPVDVVAHSQGGVVARWALSDIDPLDPALPEIGSLVTLGAPHNGADLATAVMAVNTTDWGEDALGIAGKLAGIDPDSPAAAQLSESSGFVSDLRDRQLPDGIRFTSIAARGDLTVTARRTVVAGATNVLLPFDGASAHGRLTTEPEAQREVALALAGLPPGCQSIADLMLGTVRSTAIGVVEDGVGVVLTEALRRAPRPPEPQLPLPVPTVGRSG